MTNSKRVSVVVLVQLALAVGALSCSRHEQGSRPSESAHIPTAGGVERKDAIELTTAEEIPLVRASGRTYLPVEATLTNDLFNYLTAPIAFKPEAERKQILSQELHKTFAKLKDAKAIDFHEYPEIGYFTFLLPYASENQSDLLAPLKSLKLQNLSLNPVVMSRDELRQIRELTPFGAEAGDVPRRLAPRGSAELFSGLRKMRVLEFIQEAQQDVGEGVKLNGDSVRLGITDTGITYNHPTFLSRDRSKNRITYMRDFTREGRVYFNLAPEVRFEAKLNGLSGEDFLIDAQIILTPKLPSLPGGDQLMDVKNLKVKVSAELREALVQAGSNARLGVLFEDTLQGEGEAVDINNNGKLDDRIFMILIPGNTPAEDKLFVDFSGTADFRASKPLSDWNTSHQMARVFAEKIGFDIRSDKLPSSSGGAEIPVRSASLVGFDPGNHGSHVAGIAAGSRTIANDTANPDEDTLARGVAPEAAILMNRVCANNGGCNATEAIVDLALNGQAQVINMSLGGLSPFNDGYGVQELVVNRLTLLKNVLMVISAGNSGPGKQTVGSPSVARMSLSVGAAASVGMIQRQYQWPASKVVTKPEEDEDFMLFFSSRGPTAAGGFKPNLVAPGSELSSVQLNTAPGSRGGLDVYWGTSMAAPSATGAYALLLDAIQKYNERHPEQKLPTEATVLRRALIESARPIDINRFDPQTGERSTGQYIWTDQGTGMIDLAATWRKLKQHRDEQIPAAVTLNGKSVELDYPIYVPFTNGTGTVYDGTTARQNQPLFGTGFYLDFYAQETLLDAHIQRLLPDNLATGPDGGDLTQQLLSTQDEFVLKTTIFGSDRPWLKAGVLDSLDKRGCAESEAANLVLLGRGAEVVPGKEGTGTIAPSTAGALHVCIDRRMISEELSPGDHGALIAGYRTVGGKTDSIASFWIPVYLQVPHRRLADSLAYESEGTVKSFGVKRNYVTIPSGTSLVRITLETPALKLKANGQLAEGEQCSGVELMALKGMNNEAVIPARKAARISNCDAKGVPVTEEQKRRVRVTIANPRAGTWDLHVFGSYKYAESKYKLRVDYLIAESTVKKVQGGLAALNGSMNWTLRESSVSMGPDAAKSKFVLNSLLSSVNSEVAQGASVIVEGVLGKMRQYPAGAQAVTITTGESAGNDIDLAVLECDATATSADDSSCNPVAASGSSSDVESASFNPKEGKAYAVRVDGFQIKDSGAFVSTETIRFDDERGTVTVNGGPRDFVIGWTMTAEQQAASKLLANPLFISGKMSATGALTVNASDQTALYVVPVAITAK